MVLADTLSRAYRVPSETERTASETLRGETERDVEVIKMAQYLYLSLKLRNLRCKQKQKQAAPHSARAEDSNPTRLASAEIGSCRMHP